MKNPKSFQNVLLKKCESHPLAMRCLQYMCITVMYQIAGFAVTENIERLMQKEKAISNAGKSEPADNCMANVFVNLKSDVYVFFFKAKVYAKTKDASAHYLFQRKSAYVSLIKYLVKVKTAHVKFINEDFTIAATVRKNKPVLKPASKLDSTRASKPAKSLVSQKRKTIASIEVPLLRKKFNAGQGYSSSVFRSYEDSDVLGIIVEGPMGPLPGFPREISVDAMKRIYSIILDDELSRQQVQRTKSEKKSRSSGKKSHVSRKPSTVARMSSPFHENENLDDNNEIDLTVSIGKESARLTSVKETLKSTASLSTAHNSPIRSGKNADNFVPKQLPVRLGKQTKNYAEQSSDDTDSDNFNDVKFSDDEVVSNQDGREEDIFKKYDDA